MNARWDTQVAVESLFQTTTSISMKQLPQRRKNLLEHFFQRGHTREVLTVTVLRLCLLFRVLTCMGSATSLPLLEHQIPKSAFGLIENG